MTLLAPLLAQVLHIALMLAAAPSVAGLLGWLAARLSGRTGPRLRQAWLDLARLVRKQPMATGTAAPLLRAAPAVSFAVTLAAAALVPSFTLGMALSPLGDLLVIAGLLTLARVVLTLAAMDAGTGPAGFAAAQVTSIAILAEPALLLGVFALALLGGGGNLDLIAGQQLEGMLQPTAACTLAAASLAGLAFADTTELPMALDQEASGTGLALLQVGRDLRLLTWLDLIGALFLPVGMARAHAGPLAWGIGLGAWLVRLIGFTLLLAALRALVGQLRWRHMPGFLGVSALLAVLAALLVLANVAPA